MDELSKLAAKAKMPKPVGMMALGTPTRTVQKGRPKIRRPKRTNAFKTMQANAAIRAGKQIAGKNVARSSTYSPA